MGKKHPLIILHVIVDVSIDETPNEGGMRENGLLTYPSNFPKRFVEMHALSLTFSPNFLSSKAVVGGDPSLGAILLVPMSTKFPEVDNEERLGRTAARRSQYALAGRESNEILKLIYVSASPYGSTPLDPYVHRTIVHQFTSNWPLTRLFG